jgi:predicted TIM-barrel fold metal-dependent hydrolase
MRAFKLVALCFVFACFLWWIVPTVELPDKSSSYVDMHVHTAGLGFGESDAFVNGEMRSSYKFPVYVWSMGVSERELEQSGDQLVIRRIAEDVRASKRVGRAVILAMDGVIDVDGTLNQDRTQLFIPNDFVARETSKYPELLYGASINPARPDALERLQRAKLDGAVLVKWIPNIMHIDPSDAAHETFYRLMAELELPLLSHAGQERSFAGANDTLGDPMKLALPLELGVTVIAAHIATTGKNDGVGNYERILPMFEQYPNLYADISSLTQVNKRNYLVDALTRRGLRGRIIYGSDWPLQFLPLVSPLYQFDQLDIGTMKAILAIDNQWDRDVVFKEALGVEEEVFTRTASVLGLDERRSGERAAGL